MKLATFNDGTRDGQLMVVSRDLTQAQFATGIARTLQHLLDDWNFVSPQLEALYQGLNSGRAPRAFAFDARHCLAPLPRASQRADGFAYPQHLARLRREGLVPAAADKASDKPLLQLGSGDSLHGAHEDVHVATVAGGIDFGAGLAAITGDVRAGARADEALDGVRLLTLACDWTLRERMFAELARGFGAVQSRFAASFAPVAVSTDELGALWGDGRVQARLDVHCNGRPIGRCDTGPEMAFHFGQLIAHLARTRPVRAGSVVGSGTVSNEDPERGACCLAELRALETAATGAAQTPYLQFGDRVRIDLAAADGHSLCGAIEQRVMSWRGAAANE
jgi:fumarylacetoacetate (FAA) hydrolase